MKISMGADHAGFHLKEKLKALLRGQGHEILDYGTHSDDPVDYPLFVRPAALAVAGKEADRGIVIGGSGNGEAMVANRIRGIRCALCWNPETARLARQHNDANLLSLGARMITPDRAMEIVRIWLDTPFEAGRHLERIRLIDQDRTAGDDTETKVPPETAGKGQPEGGPPSKYDVLISFRYLIYFEGSNSLEFRIDPDLKAPSIIHIPDEERWQAEMPPWAKNRREEILLRLKEKTSHMTCEWREY